MACAQVGDAPAGRPVQERMELGAEAGACIAAIASRCRGSSTSLSSSIVIKKRSTRRPAPLAPIFKGRQTPWLPPRFFYRPKFTEIEKVSHKLSRMMLANWRISEEVSWFHEEGDEVVSIVRDKLAQNLLNFYHSLHIWYHDISTSFKIFGLRLLFIEFKNNLAASSWSFFMNKMFEIGGLFLNTASHYTK